MANILGNKGIWGADLYKGFKIDKNTLLGGAIDDILPFQMLTAEEKTADWIHAVADYYEVAGWNNVEKKATRIQRNYMMRYGTLNKSDYIINPTPEEYTGAVGLLINHEHQSPLEQFYSIAPTFVDVLRGEFIKRDNSWTIETIDPFSAAEAYQDKEDKFMQILLKQAPLEKQRTLASLGITDQANPQDYEKQMQQYQVELQQVELQAKNFRTTGTKWAEKVIKIQEKRYNLHELEPDAFESGLITDSEFWHLDLMDDDFKLELLNPKYSDYHKGPSTKYVSEGDYFLWFDFMSAGDIVNKFGRRMKEEDILKLKDIYVKTANIIVPDYLKARGDSYYDLSKPWAEATELNPAMNDSMLGKELAYNYMRTPNFDHNIQDVDLFSSTWGRKVTGHPQMFRVMRLYWRSLSRIGWLTKINRDGTRDQPDWVDENYKITVPPKYDNSIVKEKTKDNLIYGEHIDWSWRPEWRHVMKISPNQKHTFWMNSPNAFASVYIDGGPVPFQFKGRNNPFDSLPPVEGCFFSYINSDPHGFIDRLRPLQIMYNIAMNKVPRKFLEDKGMKLAVDKRMYSMNTSGNTANTISPREEYEDRLNDSQIIEYSASREALEGGGQPAMPHLLNLSTIQEAQLYLQAADQIKWMAGESVGITRQRVGGQKASETATGIQQGIIYSETQTEKYFEQHANLMQRVRQRMLDAAQYYSSFQESSKEIYMNEMDESVFLTTIGMDNLLPHYNLYLQSKANVRSALQTISQFLMNENTLPITPSAKIEAIISNSIPKVLSLIKNSELEQQLQQQQQQASEQQAEQQKQQAAQQQEQQLQQDSDNQKQLDRESAERIATIRALGGVQTDSDKNGALDSQQTLEPYLRQQEIDNDRVNVQSAASAKTQAASDKALATREAAQLGVAKAKIAGEYALKVAEKNKNKFDKK